MTVSFEGIGERVLTFYNTSTADSAAAAGAPVKMSGNGEVAKCAAGERFMGVCLTAEQGFACVRTGGYVRTGYTGTAPSAGYAVLVADGSGGVKTDSASPAVGGEHLVIDVDTTAKTVGFML